MKASCAMAFISLILALLWLGISEGKEIQMERKIKASELPPHPRLLLSRKGIEELKARIERYGWAKAEWGRIKRNADRLLTETVELPPRGGNWWHWYACPKHGAALRTGKKIGEWRWQHICPVDGEVLLGDPNLPDRDYDGCVISGIHHRYSRAVRDLGLAYQIIGDERYARKAREILLAYADRYLSCLLYTSPSPRD